MAIDQEKIVAAVSQISLSNDEGLSTTFGILVQQLPTDFWNTFVWKLINNATDDSIETIEKSIIKATQEQAYVTGYHLIVSKEWNEIVAPMIERHPEDVIRGAFAILTAWGWGKLEIIELEPFTKLVVRATDYYESEMAKLGQVKRPCAYTLCGLCAAFMDLAYPRTHYPEALGTYQCQQTKGIEVGDTYGEFIITKADV